MTKFKCLNLHCYNTLYENNALCSDCENLLKENNRFIESSVQIKLAVENTSKRKFIRRSCDL